MVRLLSRCAMQGIRLACLFVAVGQADALAVVFDGDASNPGDFNDPLNWTDDVLPGSVFPGNTDPEAAVIGEQSQFANPAEVTLNTTSAAPGPIGDLRVGNGLSGDGQFDQSAGDLVTSTGKWSFLGADGTGFAPAVGRYNLSGSGSFSQTITGNNFDPQFHIGIGGGRRVFELGDMRNEGYLSVADQARFTVNNFFVGSNDDGYGQVDQTGGAVEAEAWISIGRDGGAMGVYNMSGGSLNVNVDGITVGEGAGANGAMHLSGDAAVTAPRLRVGRLDSTEEDPAPVGLLSITGDQVSISTDFLDVGSDDGTLKEGEGTLRFVSASSVSPIRVASDVTLNDGSGAGFAKLEVDLTTNPPPAGDLLLIEVGGTLNGSFMGLPQGADVPGSGGRTISYTFGDGNDIGLVDAGLPGDLNNDGQVDGEDLLFWQTGGVGAPPPSSALSQWQANYGAPDSSQGFAYAAPEPTGASLLIAALLFTRPWKRIRPA